MRDVGAGEGGRGACDVVLTPRPMSDTIAENKVVKLQYVLTDAQGTEIDKSHPDHPLLYLHGAQNIVPGLERQLAGKAVGDVVKAVVPAAEGYGEKRGFKDVRLNRSQFPADAQLAPGMRFMSQGQNGQMFPLYVKKVQGPTVIVTPEHPLAGVELHFTCTILEIRDATEEELQHGHAHGPHGHGHGHGDEGDDEDDHGHAH